MKLRHRNLLFLATYKSVVKVKGLFVGVSKRIRELMVLDQESVNFIKGQIVNILGFAATQFCHCSTEVSHT